MSHSEQCNCAECYVRRQQTPPQPVAQPSLLTVEMNDPSAYAGHHLRAQAEYMLNAEGAPVFATAADREAAVRTLTAKLAAGEGQLRDDDGRYATQDQAIRQLNATVGELRDVIASLRYDLTTALQRSELHLDGMSTDLITLKTDAAREIAKVRDDLSQLTGELELLKAGATKSRR